MLWKKVMPKLSAGQVQSVATRLVVDRERERMASRAASYADVSATLDAGADADPRLFGAKVVTAAGLRIASGKDFDARGALTARKALHLDQAGAESLADALRAASALVTNVEAKPYTRRPYAPFRTTTLQQDAGRKLGFSAERTMRVAQDLYEGGYITYMRTDSVTLSTTAVAAARAPGQGAVRRRVPAGPSPHVRQQGQERPGGPRGDPSGGRAVPDAAGDGPVRRPVPAVRPHLEADARLADDRRPGQHRDGDHAGRHRPPGGGGRHAKV